MNTILQYIKNKFIPTNKTEDTAVSNPIEKLKGTFQTLVDSVDEIREFNIECVTLVIDNRDDSVINIIKSKQLDQAHLRAILNNVSAKISFASTDDINQTFN